MIHLRRHGRFYVALACGVLVLLLTWGQRLPLRVLLAGDVFFAVFLGLMTIFALGVTPPLLRRRAAVEDEGAAVILLLTGIAVVFSLGAVFLLVNRPSDDTPLVTALAVASVPLSWAVVHTLAALHYANLYYAPADSDPEADAGGLVFPGTDLPGTLDFVYCAFVIGMTTAVSDVAVASQPMRLATLSHGVVSFFYNAVLIAFAVNAAITLAG